VRRSRTPLAALWMFALVLVTPGSAAGQEGLDAVDALASDGRTEEAREILQRWWDGERTRSDRQDRQRGLWLRALLTVDPDMAALDYQRLVVEYPGGPYSDLALVRLAMIARSDEDLLGAARYYRALLQDYPRSPERAGARQWLSDHSEQVEAAEASWAEAEVASEAADAPIETEQDVPREIEQNVLEPDDAPAGEVGRHAVQLGAFSTDESARRLAATVGRAGFDARVVLVEGSPLVRVRVGRFAERSAAVDLMGEIKGLGYDAAVVSDVANEGAIR